MDNLLIKQQEEYNKKASLEASLVSNPDPKELKRAIAVKMSCHLRSRDVCRYVWGQTNSRIEIPIKNEKDRQTYFGALDYQTKEFTVEVYPAGNGESTVKFVKNLQHKYPHKKIVLIWDGASYHRFIVGTPLDGCPVDYRRVSRIFRRS